MEVAQAHRLVHAQRDPCERWLCRGLRMPFFPTARSHGNTLKHHSKMLI